SLSNLGDLGLTSPADLAPFIGTSNLSYASSASADISDTVQGGSTLANNTVASAKGVVTVEVFYTFSSVPTLVTTASSPVTLGTTAPTLSDSAVLAAGTNPTGSITFTLTGPAGFSYTQTDTVNGNGTYTARDTPAALVAGTYTWSARYSGDVNNMG